MMTMRFRIMQKIIFFERFDYKRHGKLVWKYSVNDKDALLLDVCDGFLVAKMDHDQLVIWLLHILNTVLSLYISMMNVKTDNRTKTNLIEFYQVHHNCQMTWYVMKIDLKNIWILLWPDLYEFHRVYNPRRYLHFRMALFYIGFQQIKFPLNLSCRTSLHQSLVASYVSKIKSRSFCRWLKEFYYSRRNSE